MSKKQKTNKTKRWTAHRVINTLCVLFISGALILSAALFFMIHDIMTQKDGKKFDASDLVSRESFSLYDSDGVVFLEAAKDNENRENVDFEAVPQTVIDAFLSIEDSRFFTHNGFDLPRFVSSMLNNVKGLATGSSGIQGGSTLTMQMIDQFYTSKSEQEEEEKNGSVSTYKSIQFKIQEVFLAIDAEDKVEKSEILMKYLNQINFGAGAHGIQKASEYYFGKDVSQLNLSESAFLAGVINAPSSYNPYSSYDLAVQRRNTTLNMMKYHGYITQEQFDLALNTELAFQLDGAKLFDSEPYVAYADVAKDQASQLLGGRDVVGEGMQVYTYMDRGAQELADSISNGKVVDFPSNGLASPDYQIAFTLTQNSNGGTIALSNGRNYDSDPTKKQARSVLPKEPGSTMKPLIGYAPSFDVLGWSTAHTLDDKPGNYYGDGSLIGNSDGRFGGPTLMQDAINSSRNTTALQTYIELENKVGNAGMQEQLRNLQFSDEVVKNAKRSFVLGSGEGMGISTAELSTAYGSFANEGKANKPQTVRKILDSSGEVLYDAEASENNTAKQAYSPQASYMISTLLNNSVYSPQNMMAMAPFGFPTHYKIYGKTGTVGYEGTGYAVPDNAIKDNWMVNYTKDYSVATWIGFDKTSNTNYIEREGTLFYANLPGYINRAILNYTYENMGDPGAVTDPGGVSSIKIVKGKFPYESGEGLPDSMTVSGLIKSDFATIAAPKLPELATLDSFKVSLANQTEKTLFIVEFKPYPITEANENSSDVSIESLGKKVLYVVTVKVNGHDKLYESEDPTFRIDLADFVGSDTVTATFTGFYKVQDMDLQSNSLTQTYTIEAKKPDIPDIPDDSEEETNKPSDNLNGKP